ncbi:hypothetical protein I6F21_02540 [Bradyrhizobium sp. NBAIM03]|uniref:hypothetical protein n=1 Tax=Bradyrhizobium sp. NBAIM03 TaxID=2793816 RepID=UPI001CD6A434|nr:hypothetical protein [Bradyrhizobium sp. NBAIM03]MCA1531435.1 hypothetical protein [Bradyrhizobium sp. NBAIM03]
MAVDLENFAAMIGEEVARVQKAEREDIERQFELMRRALEVQASRIADLEASVAAPSERSLAPERTASLLAGRAE